MDSRLLLKSAVIWDVAMFEQYRETVATFTAKEGQMTYIQMILRERAI